jgi:hypothetical protein
MHLQAVMLCDAVSVRDGLLFVLGGGIDRLVLAEYPAVLPVQVAALLELEWLDQGNEHELLVCVYDEHLAELGRVQGQFSTMRSLELDEFAKFPVGISLSALSLPCPGSYEVRLLIDGELKARLPLEASAP